MRGLIVKDLLNLKKYGRTVILMIAFYIMFALMVNDAGFIGGMIIFLMAMMSITSFAYDDLAKWDAYALTFPVTRKEMVLSKYILALLLSVSGGVISLAFSMLMAVYKGEKDLGNLALTSYVLFGIAILFISVMLPLIYRFGVEKSRLIIFAVFAVPFAAFFVLSKAGFKLPTDVQITQLLILSPLLFIAAFVVSYLLSVRIYQKKDI